MKRLFFLLFLAWSLNCSAQLYVPIPESNAVWIQGAFLYSSLGHEHVTITQPLNFVQDSTILGLDYHGLSGHQIVEWIDGWGSQQNFQTGEYSVPADTLFIRQDVPNKKIFAWYENRDTLLYDFDLTIGQVYPETMTNLNYPNLIVMGQDSVQLLDGIYHKRWALGTEPSDSGYITLVEGVGASSGFSFPIHPQFEQSGAIMCFKFNGSPIYENWGVNALIAPNYSELCEENVSLDEILTEESQLLIWPNPTNGPLTIYSEKGIESVAIFNMQGRLINFESVKSNDLIELNVELLDQGYYLLYIETSESTISIRKFSRN